MGVLIIGVFCSDIPIHPPISISNRNFVFFSKGGQGGEIPYFFGFPAFSAQALLLRFYDPLGYRLILRDPAQSVCRQLHYFPDAQLFEKSCVDHQPAWRYCFSASSFCICSYSL